MNTSIKFLLLIALCTVVFASGCGKKKPPGFPKIYSTTITITQEGVPLEGARVRLYKPDAADFPWSINGTTDATGKAVISTEIEYPGAPEGKFKVCVQKSEIDEVPSVSTDASAEEIAAVQKKIKETKPKEKHFVEEIYWSKSTTPLEVDIVPSKNELNLDVGKKVLIERPIGPFF